MLCCVFFFKQKTAYEMRISDWSSDVCSSDLPRHDEEPALMFDTLQDAWRAFTDIPYIHLYVTGVWIAYMIGLGGWIVFQKREPVATLSWLRGLAALPVADRKSKRLNSSHK